MKEHIFIQKFANTPLAKRDELLNGNSNDILFGKTLNTVYDEIKDISNRVRPYTIRRQKLLNAVEKYLK